MSGGAGARLCVKHKAGLQQRRGQRRRTWRAPAATHDQVRQQAKALHVRGEQAHLRFAEEIDRGGAHGRPVDSEVPLQTREDALVAIGGGHPGLLGDQQMHHIAAHQSLDPGHQHLQAVKATAAHRYAPALWLVLSANRCGRNSATRRGIAAAAGRTAGGRRRDGKPPPRGQGSRRWRWRIRVRNTRSRPRAGRRSASGTR